MLSCRFAFGAAKGVAGWAFNQAVGAISEGATRQAGRDAKSRNIADMYDAPQTISIGDLFSSSAAPYGRCDIRCKCARKPETLCNRTGHMCFVLPDEQCRKSGLDIGANVQRPSNHTSCSSPTPPWLFRHAWDIAT